MRTFLKKDSAKTTTDDIIMLLGAFAIGAGYATDTAAVVLAGSFAMGWAYGGVKHNEN